MAARILLMTGLWVLNAVGAAMFGYAVGAAIHEEKKR